MVFITKVLENLQFINYIMKSYQFKTDIHCNGCVAKIEKALQNQKNIDSWKIDLNSKILKIHGDIHDVQSFEDDIFEKTQVYIEEINGNC